MSVLINMEMPTSCRDCRFCNGQADTDYGVCAWCEVDGKARDAYTRQDCPLVPVPPHGRLIDADELMKHKGECYDADGHLLYAVGTGNILRAPTIIPAEEGE